MITKFNIVMIMVRGNTQRPYNIINTGFRVRVVVRVGLGLRLELYLETVLSL